MFFKIGFFKKQNCDTNKSTTLPPESDYVHTYSPEVECDAADCLDSYNRAAFGISKKKEFSDDERAIEQSKNFLKYNYIDYYDKILDGFKDGGRNSKILSNGRILEGSREIILVDRKKDKKLHKIIKKVRQNLAGVRDNNEKAEYIAEVCKHFMKFNRTKLPKGKEILLGDIIGTKKACCRHLSLLFKILCDEMGVKAELIRGNYLQSDGESLSPHTWNVYLDEEKNRYILHDSMVKDDPYEYIDSYISKRMNYLRRI